MICYLCVYTVWFSEVSLSLSGSPLHVALLVVATVHAFRNS